MSELKWRVTEIASCPICLEDFKNPRSLPCVHSFCLECIKGHCKDKCPRDDVACPVCRKEFSIPEQGPEALPHNFFIQNLVDAKEASSKKPEDIFCDVCSTVSQEAAVAIPPATHYCVDCNQRLCQRCSQPHLMWRGRAHLVKPLGEEMNIELIQKRGSYCNKHPDKLLELYCFDCQINVCLMCFAISHKRHNCEEVIQVAEDFKLQISKAAEMVSSRMPQFVGSTKQVEVEKQKFLENVKQVQQKIRQRGEEMKRIVDQHVAMLTEELMDMQTKVTKKITNISESNQSAVTSLESINTYCTELISKGRPCDITRAAMELQARSEDLLKTLINAEDYKAPTLTFTESSFGNRQFAV